MKKYLATLVVLLFVLNQACAAPFKLKEKYSFTGTVSSYLWIGKSKFKYEGDNFVLKEYESEPAYYIILNIKNMDKKARDEISYMSGHVYHTLSHPFHSIELKKNQVMLDLPSAQLKQLKKGATIKVVDYTGWGDEYMSKVSWKSLTVGEKSIASPSE